MKRHIFGRWRLQVRESPLNLRFYGVTQGLTRSSKEAVMDVNSDKLNAFMGKMVGDFGAALNASLMLIGDKLGLYKTLAAKGPMNSAELARPPARPSAMFANGWRRRPHPATSNTMQREKNSRCYPSRRWRSPMKTALFSWARSAIWSRQPFLTNPRSPKRSRPAGRRLEPAQRVPILRHGAVLPHRLQTSSGAGMAASA